MSSPQLPPDQSAKESNSPQVDSETAGGDPVEAEEIVDTSNDTETVTVPRDEDLYQRSLDNALIAARCADEMRAQDVVVLDMTEIASIVDFFVIGTSTSRRQMHAIADEVNRKLKGDGGNDRLGIEGYRTEANWILMDFGDVVLHVFTEEGRELYDLENLKADAKRIDWQAVTPADG
jgi:ribosome-associated protein